MAVGFTKIERVTEYEGVVSWVALEFISHTHSDMNGSYGGGISHVRRAGMQFSPHLK